MHAKMQKLSSVVCAALVLFGEMAVLAWWQLDSYHSHRQMEEFLLATAKNNKDIAFLYSIGKSVMGRELWVMELTGANKSQVGAPNVKLIGNMHGNEPVGREIIIHMIRYLVDQYRDGEEDVVRLLSTTKVHLMPAMNPDGYHIAVEGLCAGGTGRDNARRQDLNRNFPGRSGSRRVSEQPETSAVRKWMSSVQFVLSASLHSGALLVSYPFDSHPEDNVDTLYDRLSGAQSDEEFDEIWQQSANGGWGVRVESPTPDDDVFKHLATLYSRQNPSIALGCGQDKKFEGGIVNGALWYPMSGSMQDYNYLFHGCLEVTLEISCCKYPLANQLEGIWRKNYQALIKLMGEAQRGVKGVVRDGRSGRPLAGATVSIEGTDRKPTNTTSNGEYWKILLPGRYFLKVEADGYWTRSQYIVVPASQLRHGPLVLDVDLESVTGPRVGDTAKTTTGNPPVVCSSDSLQTAEDSAGSSDVHSASVTLHPPVSLFCPLFVFYNLRS